MAEYITDTHPLIWFLTNHRSLSRTAKNIFLDPNNIIHVPILVLIETNYLFHKKRITCSGEDLQRDIECLDHWFIQGFNKELLNYCLSELSIHDAMICAYAVQKKLSVITKDKAIQDHSVIQTVW